MNSKKSEHINQHELEVLELLWDADRPLSRPELLSKSSLSESNKQTIHRFLNSMLEKGVLRVAGSVICGKRPGRTYEPTISREEYMLSQIDRLMPTNSPKKSLLTVMSSLVDESYVDEEFISELEEIIQKRRKELHDK